MTKYVERSEFGQGCADGSERNPAGTSHVGRVGGGAGLVVAPVGGGAGLVGPAGTWYTPLMGILTFGLNLTLDGCYDHRVGVADDDLHDYFTQLMDAAGAMLWGRVTYELMEGAWPAVARDESAPRAMQAWARKLEAKPKYVVSSSRTEFLWNNTVRLEGDLYAAVKQLKEQTPRGVLVGSPTLGLALEQLGLVDEYRLVVHPVLAGHGPTLFQGLESPRQLALVATKQLASGQMAMHYRRKGA